MSNKVDKCVVILAMALLFLMFGSCAMFSSYYSMPINEREYKIKNEYVREPRTFEENPMWWLFEQQREFWYVVDRIPIYIDVEEVVLYDGYKMFITAYCAEECGWSYSTSSGEICHRSSEANRYEPTTCAIDRSYFSYGTMFYIPSEDRVYIAEDTGPGVRGYWIDTYQDDMSDVIGYNTRYEYCYTCDVIEYSYLLPNRVCVRDLWEMAYECKRNTV